MARELSIGVAIHRTTAWLARLAGVVLASWALSADAAQTDIPGPVGSGAFGTTVTVLPNGNIVVTDPSGPVSNVGAVYLYSPTGVLISTLTGSGANDQIGSHGVTVLNNGNYVIRSPFWNNESVAQAGAVTWADGRTGISGLVTPANSLIGTTPGDQIGADGVTALSNGNYVVRSRYWDNGSSVNAGAVTWANGGTGLAGPVSLANSLAGTTTEDSVGSNGVTELANGNYVISSAFWDNAAAEDAGAVTWADGSTGLAGVISSANSLVGTTTGDQVGVSGVTALGNGNYVVPSSFWDNGVSVNVGAVTWANGSTGRSGLVSSGNSLIGRVANDAVGSGGVIALSGTNYVVVSPTWNNSAITDAGAVTWASGTAELSGIPTSGNSLVGTTANDQVGAAGVTALSNGNYVVASPFWGSGDVGAVTWASGNSGLAGAVSAANSLVGTTTDDLAGLFGVTALTNGNYVVISATWDNAGTSNVGAVTWANGGTGLTGAISPANSLIGTQSGDQVGFPGVTALSNGNYVVRSAVRDNGASFDAGAVTWGNGSTGLSGAVSAANSLVGTANGDQVGSSGVTALSNGNYVVASPSWGASNVGAVTWADGSAGLTGIVAPANSLLGSSAGDFVGDPGVTALGNGDYVVNSSLWDNGAIVDAGAVTLGLGDVALTGSIVAANSVRGTETSLGMPFGYDASREQLVVGRPASNIVSLFRLSFDLIFTNGFE